MLAAFKQKIKRQETPLFSSIYALAKAIRAFNMPTVKVIHLPLYSLSRWVINLRWLLQQALWSGPVFKARCASYGKNLRMFNGMPWVEGDLIIHLGDNVTLGQVSFASGHVFDSPQLIIGNNTLVNDGSTISVNKEVRIGNDVKIAFGCFIADSNGHPIDPTRRHGSLIPEEVRPVLIEDNVWICSNCTVLKGVTIGKNSVISAGSVVVSDIPPNVVAGGNPAKVIKHIGE